MSCSGVTVPPSRFTSWKKNCCFWGKNTSRSGTPEQLKFRELCHLCGIEDVIGGLVDTMYYLRTLGFDIHAPERRKGDRRELVLLAEKELRKGERRR